MADIQKQIPQKLLDIWKSWSVKQRVLIIGSIVAFIAVVSIVAIVLTRPKYEVLVTCEDYTEMNSVTTLLTDNNHKYKINNMVVSVNSKELTACNLLLASQNLQSDGYTFEDAMKLAVEMAEPGDAVLLSPACASWGMFPNYEVRGDKFKEIVNSL